MAADSREKGAMLPDGVPELHLKVNAKITETEVQVVINANGAVIDSIKLATIDKDAFKSLQDTINKLNSLNMDQLDNFLKPFRALKDKSVA